MSGQNKARDRVEELLVEETERPLNAQEQKELNELLRANPDLTRDEIELAAAAAMLAFHEYREVELPGALVDRIREEAKEIEGTVRLPLDRSDTVAKVVKLEPRKGSRWKPIVLGIAAGIILAILAALIYRMVIVDGLQGPARDELRIAWTKTEDPWVKQIAGEVTWSPSEQRGAMRFVGLPKNDPKQNQYQLWIFDGERDERYPVDGGVFDANDGETIVRIDPKLRVNKATLFAITLEPPGGVVVSKREHILVVAKVL